MQRFAVRISGAIINLAVAVTVFHDTQSPGAFRAFTTAAKDIFASSNTTSLTQMKINGLHLDAHGGNCVTIHGHIGSGRTSCVFDGTLSGDAVALKIHNPAHDSTTCDAKYAQGVPVEMTESMGDDTAAVFGTEVGVMYALNHPSIPKCVGVVHDGYVMERVDGWSVVDLNDANSADASIRELIPVEVDAIEVEDMVAMWFAEVIIAVIHMRAHDFYHNDLDRANVMISKETKQSMLVDFGDASTDPEFSQHDVFKLHDTLKALLGAAERDWPQLTESYDLSSALDALDVDQDEYAMDPEQLVGALEVLKRKPNVYTYITKRFAVATDSERTILKTLL